MLEPRIKPLLSAISLLVFILTTPLLVWAEDFSTLITKRISHDGKTLDLSGLKIGKKGAKQLAKMESLSEITTLYLQGNNIRSGGMKALAKSPHLAGLKHLDLLCVHLL